MLEDSDSGHSLRRKLAEAMESVASVSAMFAGAVVLAAGTHAPALGLWGTFAGVGVLLAAAVLHILLGHDGGRSGWSTCRTG